MAVVLFKIFGLFRLKGGDSVLSENRILEIERAAWNALNEIGVNSELDFPMVPTQLAEHWKIPIKEVRFKDPNISGAISRNNGGVVILVNEWDATVRKRFTIAHELGHYVLHLNQDPNGFPDDRVDYKRTLFDGRSHTPEEEEANRYAAALLMPAPILGKILVRGENSIQDLLGMFGVSEEAMSIRLNALRRMPELLHEFR